MGPNSRRTPFLPKSTPPGTETGKRRPGDARKEGRRREAAGGVTDNIYEV